MSMKLMRDVRRFSTEKYNQDFYQLHLALAAVADNNGYFECSPVELSDLMNRNAESIAGDIYSLEFRGCLSFIDEKYYGDNDSELGASYDESCRFQLVVPIPRMVGCIYAIKFDDYYKIGRTQYLNQRIPQLAIQLPKKPSLIHYIYSDNPMRSENLFHQWWDDIRLNGEWFDLKPLHLDFFCSVKEAICDGELLFNENHRFCGGRSAWQLFLTH